MNPSCGLVLHPSQSQVAPLSQKRGGGLLSRLFNSLPSDRRVESTSASSKQHGGASLPSVCTSALPASSVSVASTVLPSYGPTGHASHSTTPDLNFKRNIDQKYVLGRELGKGGNGVVRVVTHRETGEEFACKSIPKFLKDASEKKKQGHLESIRREVQVLTKLRGSLNVVKLEDVFEDDDSVYLIMENCTGGELWHRIGERHYSERTVASFMRAVLRTLAQCHAQNILHRDIKPGNFMLLSEDDRAPVKAIDFGLAAPFEPQQLPRTDLGLEGTPWYMAPETLRGEWSPASDMWAAGVMAYQLLSGRFPFDDKKNSFAPAITAIWRSVLNDPLDFKHPCWSDISAEAKDFCQLLLSRDVAARPSAREALKHPWLRGDSSERSVGKQLSRSVVARIQRFASGSLLRRSVLKSIASELLSHPELIAANMAATDCNPHHQREGTVGELSPSAAVATEGDALATTAAALETGGGMSGGAHGEGGVTSVAAALGPVLSQLRLDQAGAALDEAQLGEALTRMGFRLAPSEVARLMEGLDTSRRGAVCRAALAASLVDWRHLQRNHTELWLELAAKAFRQLDSDGSGVLEVEELLSTLRARLPPEEVRGALQEALEEATAGGGVGLGLGAGAPQGMDFNAFIRLLKVGSHDSLDMYDDRSSLRSGGSRDGSLDRYNALLAAASYHRSAALATSCSTIGTDWSRHGPGGSRHGGSRHGGSRHGGGGGGGDASMHSCISDQSDVTSMPDNDRSQHGSGQLPQPSYRHTVAAAPLPGAIAFRFDTDRTDKAATIGGKTSVPAAAAAAASIANPGAGASVGMIWRFDVGGPKAPPPPPPAAPVWRFDVCGGGIKSSLEKSSAQEAAPHGSGSASDSGNGDSSNGGGGSSLSGTAVRQQGGYFDRRMHGSNLYRNVALRALQGGAPGAGLLRGGCLDTVAE